MNTVVVEAFNGFQEHLNGEQEIREVSDYKKKSPRDNIFF